MARCWFVLAVTSASSWRPVSTCRFSRAASWNSATECQSPWHFLRDAGSAGLFDTIGFLDSTDEEIRMVSPQPAPPVNATGLPPGVEVGGLGKRFLAHLIDRLVLVLLAVAAVYLAPRVGGDIGVVIQIAAAVLALAWVLFVWWGCADRDRHRIVAHADLPRDASTQTGLARPSRARGGDQAAGPRAAEVQSCGRAATHTRSDNARTARSARRNAIERWAAASIAQTAGPTGRGWWLQSATGAGRAAPQCGSAVRRAIRRSWARLEI